MKNTRKIILFVTVALYAIVLAVAWMVEGGSARERTRIVLQQSYATFTHDFERILEEIMGYS